MFGKAFQRTWVSPIVAVSFLAVGISGILMLLHVRIMALKELHEWIGVLLVVAGAIHLILNWKAFLGHFRNRSAVVALVVAIMLCLVFMFGGGDEGRAGGPHGGYPPMGPGFENPPAATGQTNSQ